MSMDSTLKIAVILSAFDRMSSVVNSATSNAQKKMKDMMSKSFMEGGILLGAGQKVFNSLQPAVEAFGQIEEAGNKLKASMMGPGGALNEDMYNKVAALTMNLSDKYKGSAASYMDMVAVLKNNRIDEKDVLGGIGESTAKLADLFQMIPADIAAFSAHMKNDMGVLPSQMDQMMDTIARVHNAGVGITGSEAVTEMNEFFSKASLGAANLGVQGVEATKQMGALGALFMSRGLSGQSVGTNFRRIFDGLRDATKVQKATDIAKQFGIQLQFFDKKGKFLGIDNFVKQAGKMQNLNPQAVQSIFKAFGGKQGLSTDFLEYLGKNGLAGVKEFNKKIDDQASLTEKLTQIMKGVNYQQGVMNTSWTNLKATFGSAMKPALDAFYSTMNKIITSLRAFLEEHPKIAKFIATFVALAGAALMLAGIIKIIQGIRFAFILLNITMAANPFILIATAAIIAITLIYTYWDKIKAFFIRLWDAVKKIFLKVWEWIKNLLLNYTPEGLIIKHWAVISAWFANLWEIIKVGVAKAWEAIKNIILAPIEFIKKKWQDLVDWFEKAWKKIKGWASTAFNWVVESPTTALLEKMRKDHPEIERQMAKMGQTIDDYLPHSPAKKGPLSNLNKIRIVQTIADTIKPNLLNSKMRMLGNTLAGSGVRGGRSGSSYGHTFNVTVNLSGGASKRDGEMVSAAVKKQIIQILNQHDANKARVGFG